jgi:hypothetical protein
MSTADVQRILWYLEDDKATGRKGLYSMVESMKAEQHQLKAQVEENKDELIDRIKRVEEAQRFDKWRFTTIGGAVGAIVAVIAKGLWALIAKVIF